MKIFLWIMVVMFLNLTLYEFVKGRNIKQIIIVEQVAEECITKTIHSV